MKWFGLIGLALLASPAYADEAAVAAHTELQDCVIQEVLPGKNMTGAFLRFRHQGEPVRMLRAEVPSISQRIELHQMVVKDGVMEMAPLNNLLVNEGERVFRKGGDHVMLFDIAEKPAIGSKHTITIHFSDGTRASCEAVVKSIQDVMRDAGIDPGAAKPAGH